MTIEPERDDVFRYATFAVAGITVVVLLCFTFLFIAPQRNPVLALRPVPPTQEAEAFELPPTWTPSPTVTRTPTSTNTPTRMPTPTLTATARSATPRPTNTPLPTVTLPPTATSPAPSPVPPTRAATLKPTAQPLIPTSTPRPVFRTPVPPTRTPVPRTATPRPATKTPLPQYDFVQGRPVEKAPNCGTWYLSGTVYSDRSASQRLNGILVRVYNGKGQVLGTVVTGTNSNRPGYWEYIFPRGSAVRGELAIVRPDGSLRSPRRPYHLTAACTGSGAVNQFVLDFVGTH